MTGVAHPVIRSDIPLLEDGNSLAGAHQPGVRL
jgi:hypothetical protein